MTSHEPALDRRLPITLLALTWSLAAAATLVPGALLFSLAEEPVGRRAGAGLAALALPAVVAALRVSAVGVRARRLSLVTSAVFVPLCLAVPAVLGVRVWMSWGGFLMFGGAAALAGLVAAVLVVIPTVPARPE